MLDMSGHRLPPIHDTVRLWDKNESAVLQACLAFRKKAAPGWTLAFLREKAPYVFGGQLSENSLRVAVRRYVPPESQRSVFEGLGLLLRFIQRHQWEGKELPPCDMLFDGLPVELRPVGTYYSHILKQKFALALQPRLENVPTDEQFRIWLSALNYRYCHSPADSVSPMIVDLSKNPVSGKRELRELISRKIPLLSEAEMNTRLHVVASNYKMAINQIPELPTKTKPKTNPGQGHLSLR